MMKHVVFTDVLDYNTFSNKKERMFALQVEISPFAFFIERVTMNRKTFCM